MTALKSAGGLLALVLVVVIIGAAVWFTAPIRGAIGERNRIQGDGTYRIATYDAFYDKCAAVQALEDQLDAMRHDTTLPPDQRATNVLALTNQRNTLIRDYNADSAKTDTRAHFKASDLPYNLATTQEHTSCAS